ncbi:MAG: hypothetical protein BWX93_01893 [Bacteroidetes bacterium ADurb.Bin139]|nr:MAG: hypothetical protein BWX93_01893 [Bacteroidetes bacterium ADurb.Bin139]
MRIYDLYKAGKCFFHRGFIPCGDGGRQIKKGHVSLGIIILAQRLKNLGQVVHDKSKIRTEHLVAKLLCFPSGQVGMHPVQEGRIVIIPGQSIEQICVFEHVGHRVVRIADHDHGRFGLHDIRTPGERLVGHVVFHDIYQPQV